MTAPPPSFGPPQGEQEIAALEDLECQCFALTAEQARQQRQRVLDKGSWQRVLREEGWVTAMSFLIPMGQWWGGRRVPLAGVSGVGVAPARRGLGTGTRLLRETLQEARGQGFPLAALYPSTQPLYRRVGFEQAGARFEYRVPISGLPAPERSLTVRPVEAGDVPALEDVYRRHAREQQGWLDRGPHLWGRVTHPLRAEPVHGYLVEGVGGVEGYLYLLRRTLPQTYRQELTVQDLVALTPAAGRRLLGFIGDHGSMATEVLWRGGPADPLLFHLREQSYQVKLSEYWMLRVLDVPAALQARGYPAGLSGSLHLEVEDDLFPENQGRFVLEVSDGEAQVQPGGDGDLKLPVRTLAALYSGFLPPAALRLAGVLEAREAALRTATALFSGQAPAMPDMF